MDHKINQFIVKYTPFLMFILFSILVLLIIFYSTDVKNDNNDFEDISNIIFVQEQIKLNYGDSIQLKDYIEYHKDINLIWESDNNEFVSVDQNGNIHILENKDGVVTITVYSDDRLFNDSIKLNIRSKLSNNNSSDNMSNNSNSSDNMSNNSNSSDNESSNSNSNISNNDSSDITPTIPVTGINFNDKEISLTYGESKKLVSNISPSNASNKKVIWSSNNSNFVKVDQNGNINILKNMNGSVVISAKTEDGNYVANITLNIKKKIIKVNGISLNKSKDKILLNNSSPTVTLKASVFPEDADDKSIIWSSSNEDIASVKNGVVTGHKLGKVTITAKTKDGNYTASSTISVEKNIIIVIGASQVTRMAEHKKSYSVSNNNYKVSDNTLIYIHKSGSLIVYQTSTGFDLAMDKINSIAFENKEFINFHILFPLVGNTIKNFDCNNINTSNKKINEYVINYNNSIKKVIDKGYKANGYVVSMHPVVVSEADSSYVVVNENKNSCDVDYRSNRKYNYFNNAIKSIMNNNSYKYVQYIDTFNQIMTVNNIDKNYSYKISYKTDDGVHWKSGTTSVYVDMMLNSIKGL